MLHKKSGTFRIEMHMGSQNHLKHINLSNAQIFAVVKERAVPKIILYLTLSNCQNYVSFWMFKKRSLIGLADKAIFNTINEQKSKE